MRARSSFEYAIVRVVPRVEREEFINVGVIVHSHDRDYLDARIELCEKRLAAFAGDTANLALVKKHLASIPIICKGGEGSGPIGKMPRRERWHWLTAPRSTIIQTSQAHAGLCEEPSEWLERLLGRYVRVGPRSTG